MTFIREHVVKRFTRGKGWRTIRNKFLKENPVCAVCGKKKGLEVHHKKPVSWFPDSELAFWNLTTLCRKHHLRVGHVGYWRMYNPCIEKTIACYKEVLGV